MVIVGDDAAEAVAWIFDDGNPREAAVNPTPSPPFELHLATSRETTRLVDGRDHPGDPDLLLHFAVCRDHATPVLRGPPPRVVFAPVPRGWLLAGLVRELGWAERHGTIEYRVLNACRFAAQGVLCSKLDGGRWAHDRLDDPSVVDIALDRQRGPVRPRARPDQGPRARPARAAPATRRADQEPRT